MIAGIWKSLTLRLPGKRLKFDFFLEVKISTDTDGNITEIKYSWDGAG